MKKGPKPINQYLAFVLLLLSLLPTIAALWLYFSHPQGSGLISLLYVFLGLAGILAAFFASFLLQSKFNSLIAALFGLVFLLVGAYVALAIIFGGNVHATGRSVLVVGFPALTGLMLLTPARDSLFPKKRKSNKRKKK